MASGDKFYIADKATLDEVKGKIGSTTDTGGSSTAGTMMAKENAILGEVGKLGATNDAQSSSITTGSIFAKLNYLVNQISLYLSNIFTRIGAQADSNNTGSKSSSAHGKLNWFIDLFGKTDDDGGSLTAGSVMAKANRLISSAGEVVKDGISYIPNVVVSDLSKQIESEVQSTNVRAITTKNGVVYAYLNFDKKVISFDADTLAKIAETIELPYQVISICYDKGILYCAISDGKLITFEANTLVKLNEVSTGYAGGVAGIKVFNNTIYVNTPSPSKIIAYDANTLVKKAETAVQAGFAYDNFIYEGNIYYADSVAKKVIAFDVNTLAKTGETVALENQAFNIFVYDGVLYYPYATAKIAMFHAKTFAKIGEAVDTVSTQYVLVKDKTLFCLDLKTKTLVALDAKTLVKTGASQNVHTGTIGVLSSKGEYIYALDGAKIIKYKVLYSVKDYALGGSI